MPGKVLKLTIVQDLILRHIHKAFVLAYVIWTIVWLITHLFVMCQNFDGFELTLLLQLFAFLIAKKISHSCLEEPKFS